MRVGARIKELCAALEGMGSATAAEIHRAAFPDLDVNSVRTYCSRSVGWGSPRWTEAPIPCGLPLPRAGRSSMPRSQRLQSHGLRINPP